MIGLIKRPEGYEIGLINADPVDAFGENVENANQSIYYVPLLKTLYIFLMWLDIRNNSGSPNRVRLDIRNPSDVLLESALIVSAGSPGGNSAVKHYFVGRKVTAGCRIYLYSPAGAIYASGGISGCLKKEGY